MRIFIIGNSFAYNLYNTYNIPELKSESIERYVISILSDKIEKPKWFTEWLVDFGYEIYDFTKQTQSIEDSIYQFKNMDENFKEGDRIIFWVTDVSGFIWYDNDGNDNTATLDNNLYSSNNKDFETLLHQQSLNRTKSSSKEDGYLYKNIWPFLNYLINLHSKYKPIVLTPFKNTNRNIKHNKYFFNYDKVSDKINQIFQNTIYEETNNLIENHHYGRISNYFLAHEIDTIIKMDLDGNYNDNKDLIKKLKFLSFDLDFNFKIPKKWL
jgi:hypothetical protein